MKYKRCRICNLSWNVSKKNKDKIFICPDCQEKAKKHGNTPKVLLKNKNKYVI
ncbi:hypothetical protein [Clostridium sp.]|uniref:hypothetical protein n=1 Tax=Clostridium sp. TaxID=1506 RepID=UPI002845DB0C|nr:hypothetical protein [Clostridium sp.]MDR3595144.1 hypothetical protein [Clostridium sp.]